MPKVLIVDDHPVVREGIGRVLTSSLPDVELGEADGAVQAQEMMRERAWDLVLLDLTLAGDDGTVVLRRVRQTHPDVPVVIISMHPAEQFARRWPCRCGAGPTPRRCRTSCCRIASTRCCG